jgi:hypothetical protein
VNIKRVAIIHTVVSVVAIVPSIGLAIGLTIAAADSNTGALASVVVWLSVLFPAVLVVSVVAVWIAFGTGHVRAVQAAIGFPWVYLLLLVVATATMAVVVAQR